MYKENDDVDVERAVRSGYKIALFPFSLPFVNCLKLQRNTTPYGEPRAQLRGRSTTTVDDDDEDGWTDPKRRRCNDAAEFWKTQAALQRSAVQAAGRL